MPVVIPTVLTPPYSFRSPIPGQEFAAWIIGDDSLSSDGKLQVARELIGQGCRYAVCSGTDGSAWDDAVDLAYIESHPDNSRDSTEFVMTTWHDDESMEDIAAFFALNTTFDDFVPRLYVVVGVGGATPVDRAVALTSAQLGGLRPNTSLKRSRDR
ncbi:MAG TPA: hypothetical protein VK624_05840 [Steroidobacteraceae bacterium]|nr:hypothetical protein [Steroidobacteraceae bacterium]